MDQRLNRAQRPSQGVLDQCSDRFRQEDRTCSRRCGRRRLLHGGDVVVDRGQTVRPVAALKPAVAVGNVAGVHAGRHVGDLCPRLSRRVVGLDRGLEHGSRARVFEQCIQHCGAQLPAEKASQPDLDLHIEREPAEGRRVAMWSACPDHRQILGGDLRKVFHPLGNFNG